MSSISKEYVFKKNNGALELVGDFDGLYNDLDNPWGQDGSDDRLGNYYKFSQNNILKHLLNITNSKIMLEVGCGLGYVVDFFNKNSHLMCEGADISKVAINKASVSFPQYTFYQLDIQDDIRFMKKKYDIVILNQVLWYVLERFENVFENVFHLLNKNGIFIISNAFMESQGYGKNIVDGFGGLVQYIENRQRDKFNILDAQLLNKEGMLYKDGCVVMEKCNE
ncbi:class I SAM-dependent methyltransferase [Aliarcobacter cryaerophilus]|jgi:SAM-dependent methyltransferase|uniref:class I SAM-dependent methyltransferase n=1 Tax=Aliarcobacter cryaerophilus TaxID=28198 RepID=UPI0021B55104|nr:class I SAM-dependent methyltransferase [Aliarcobacter cryaerophilus]MCT7530902.1 class I SAM-dependent methyltransferase [Aliarcobacter cryaerophilus]